MRLGSNVRLCRVKSSDYKFLYKLLKNRAPKANISHKVLPTYEEHQKFVKSKPYKVWYIIYFGNIKVGSVYLSKQNEIGIFLLKEYQGKNIGHRVLRLLMQKNPQHRYLANVNPKNFKSINFFKKNKFKLIQHTYEFILDDRRYEKED